MEEKKGREKRRFERFNTGKEVFFQVAYDIKTKVSFQLVDKEAGKTLSRKYIALSKNVNVEGMCFTCTRELSPGDILVLEVNSMSSKRPVYMKGEVKWSSKNAEEQEDGNKFSTGVMLLDVEGKPVPDTFHKDENGDVVWSGVLEAILGSFQK